jgi:hypothetical protein
MFPLFPLFMQVNAGENNELYSLVLDEYKCLSFLAHILIQSYFLL